MEEVLQDTHEAAIKQGIAEMFHPYKSLGGFLTPEEVKALLDSNITADHIYGEWHVKFYENETLSGLFEALHETAGKLGRLDESAKVSSSINYNEVLYNVLCEEHGELVKSLSQKPFDEVVPRLGEVYVKAELAAALSAGEHFEEREAFEMLNRKIGLDDFYANYKADDYGRSYLGEIKACIRDVAARCERDIKLKATDNDKDALSRQGTGTGMGKPSGKNTPDASMNRNETANNINAKNQEPPKSPKKPYRGGDR